MRYILINMSKPPHQVEQFAIQVLPGGDGFVLDLANARHEAVRLEFPSWMLHQLMRVFPRVDAALHEKQQMVSSALIAYSVMAWSIERSGVDDGVALCLRNDRLVESGYHFALEDARVFHRELGEAIARATTQSTHGIPPTNLN